MFSETAQHQLLLCVSIFIYLYLIIHLQVPEVKDLVIDPQLMKPFDHFTGASFLKVTTKSLNYHH